MAPENSTEAPQQHKQPSRRGKRAWRKHVDISDVQAGLEEAREEVIQGGILADKSSDSLFALDITGSSAIQAAYNKTYKPLRSDQILAQRSAIPSVDTHKRPVGVTDGIINSSGKRYRGNGLSSREYKRLKGLAYGKQSVKDIIEKGEAALAHDPWAVDLKGEEYDPRFDYLEKPKQIRIPTTMKEAPISLIADANILPAVPKPNPGISYNPVFQDWDSLLASCGAKEVEAEKNRLAAAQAEVDFAKRIAVAQQEAEREAVHQTEDESVWEGFESDVEKTGWLSKKRPGRKTPQERRKAEKRKERQRKDNLDRKERQKERLERRIEDRKAEIDERVMKGVNNREVPVVGDEQDEVDDTALRRRKLGADRIPQATLELVLPDELQDSLRLLKPEGNLLKDRFRNLLVRGKMEMRKPISRPKKRRTLTEKWTYKDFQLPV
ncbi:MAG: hypothetical protein Q9217_003758 [Psora testacea]